MWFKYCNCTALYCVVLYSVVRCTVLQSYVNCALGVHRIGYVIVAYGAVSAVASLVVGHVTATHIRRVYVVISGATFNAALLLALAWWTPDRDDLGDHTGITRCYLRSR